MDQKRPGKRRQRNGAARVHRVARIAGALVALALAFACTWSALDRRSDARGGDLSEATTRLAVVGPRQARELARKALIGRDLGEALRWSRLAVAKDPVAPGSTALLGSTLISMGKAEEGQAAFKVAALGGWRELSTQIYWLSVSNAMEDYAAATLRIEALLRQNAKIELIRPMMVVTEMTPEGRAALAARLPLWPFTPGFAGDAFALEGEEVDNRIDVLIRAVKGGTPLNNEVLSSLIGLMLDHGRGDEAAVLWQGSVRGAPDPRKGIFNANFERPLPEGPAARFDWRSPASGALQVRIAEAPESLHGNALQIRSSSSVREPALQQSLVFPPGTYTLSWMASGPASSLPGVWAGVHCEREGSALREERDLPSRRTVFTVPSDGCRIQTLTIWVEPQDSGSDGVWIDDLRVAAAQ
ncbi:MAG: hypothetical protein WDN24_13285 [Sphingomonas sp.]